MKNSFTEQRFEKAVGKILARNYILLDTIWNDSFLVHYDFIASNEVIFEVKYSFRNDFSRILAMIENYFAAGRADRVIFVINLPGEAYGRLADGYKKEPGIPILTLDNLLYLCGGDEGLKSELLSCISFSTETVTPLPPDEKVAYMLKGATKAGVPAVGKIRKSFRKELAEIAPGGQDAKRYEEFCGKLIETIFCDSLDPPVTQQKNNRDRFRFDLVAALKNDPKSFWRFIYDKFDSCFILIECKNYKEAIGQEQIYLTERYLYQNALRNVALIFTREGADKSAYEATKDILKEHGKLMLIFDDRDVGCLERVYEAYIKDGSGPSPSDYLMDKVKQFLLDLDK